MGTEADVNIRLTVTREANYNVKGIKTILCKAIRSR